MTGAAECLGRRSGISQCTDGSSPVLNGNSGSASLKFIDCNGKGCTQHRGVVIDLHIETQLLAASLRDGDAQHAAGILEHEVYILGGNLFGGDDEVAFVLAVLVIDYHHKLAGAEILDRVLDFI